jgi:5'(3')-deoxyribonucleotidase
MICSQCSALIRPIVAIDIDGTLADYHSHFVNFAMNYTNSVMAEGYDGSCDFNEWIGISKEKYREIKLAYRQGGLKRWTPAFTSAKTLMQVLKAEEVEIWITTTRPYLRLDNIDPDTRFWLEQNDISYSGLLYDEDKYQVLYENVDHTRVVAILDDLPEMFDRASELFGEDVPIMIAREHNITNRRTPLAVHLDDARNQIVERIRTWL